MRFLSLLIVVLLSTWNLATAQYAVPDIALKTLDGKNVELTDYVGEGKPVILTYWATWCSPCKRELDTFTDLYEEWQELYGVEIIAVSIDTRRALAKVGPMVESKGWPFTILSDANKQSMAALNFQTVPQLFLVDKMGKIVYRHSGFSPNGEYELEEQLQKLQEGEK